MSGRVAFAYGQARIQARYGRLLTNAEWNRLERVADFGQAVQLAQATALRPWLLHVGPESDVHQIELALRLRYRRHVRRVATWLPESWHAAVTWMSVLADLPAARRLLLERPPPTWMRNDPLYAPLAGLAAPERAAAIGRSVFAPLAGEGDNPAGVSRRWLDYWRGLWPSPAASVRRSLEALAGALIAPVPTGAQAISLARTIRRETQRPAAAFAYLGLVRREGDRLRGLLARRRVLPGAA